ncbi:hypothetical protein DFH06DRAFT_1328051 [Mycena polygramma]|nr:hypothetical protein DFH06DRAFT_1328051 [Mycena polygramma]
MLHRVVSDIEQSLARNILKASFTVYLTRISSTDADDGLRRRTQEILDNLHALRAEPESGVSSTCGHASQILFALENNADTSVSILPAALYRAGATHQSHDIIIGNVLTGLPRVDGELVQMADKDKTPSWGNFDVWSEAVGQQGRCIHPELACRRTPKVVKAHYRGSPVSHVPPLAYNIDHFYGLANLCPPCEVSVRMRLHETLETLWAELPSVFGLPSWEDIEQEMARFRPSTTEE